MPLTPIELRSRIHMIFGHHQADQIGNIRRITEEIPRSGGRHLFIAELGGIHHAEFVAAYLGTSAVANSDHCLGTGEVNDQFKRDVSRFIDVVNNRIIWQEIAKREPARSGFVRTSKKHRKQRGTVSSAPIPTSSLEEIAQEKTFQLALLLMAKQKGFEVATEVLSAEAVLYVWISMAHEQDFMLYWANARPSQFKFQALLDCAKTSYKYLQLHQLHRDRSFSERLIADAARYNCVVVQRGIGHRGFYQREMPGVNIYSHSEPQLAEKLLHDGVLAEDLSCPQVVLIVKDIVARVVSNYSSLSPFEAARLMDKLPQNMTSLEKFLIFSNAEFCHLLDPYEVVANIIAFLNRVTPA